MDLREPRLRLTLLAPELVEAVLNGRQSEGVRLEDLLAGSLAELEVQKCVLASALQVHFEPPPGTHRSPSAIPRRAYDCQRTAGARSKYRTGWAAYVD